MLLYDYRVLQCMRYQTLPKKSGLLGSTPPNIVRNRGLSWAIYCSHIQGQILFCAGSYPTYEHTPLLYFQQSLEQVISQKIINGQTHNSGRFNHAVIIVRVVCWVIGGIWQLGFILCSHGRNSNPRISSIYKFNILDNQYNI